MLRKLQKIAVYVLLTSISIAFNSPRLLSITPTTKKIKAKNNTVVDLNKLNSAAKLLQSYAKPYIDNKRNAGNGNFAKIIDNLSKNPSNISSLSKRLPAPPGTIIERDFSGKPIFISNINNSLHDGKTPKLQSTAQLKNYVDYSIGYVTKIKNIFELANPALELANPSEYKDSEGDIHITFEQNYNGIPVWDKEIICHFNKSNELYMINCRLTQTPETISNTKENINTYAASDIVTNNYISSQKIIDPGKSQKIGTLINQSKPEKYIWCDRKTEAPFLVWKIEFSPAAAEHWIYFIDIASGKILEKYNTIPFDGKMTAQAKDYLGQIKTINVYLETGKYYLYDLARPMYNNDNTNPKGTIITFDNNNTDLTDSSKYSVVRSSNNIWADPVSVSAHNNIGLTYEYYRTVHGRNSIDNNGMNIYSIIHVTDKGASFPNAYWNGSGMIFGDGGDMFYPLAAGLDVVAHELTHGVVEYTVGLEYAYQSGAMNEAIADWGGVMVDREDWYLGEDVAKKAYFPTGRLRDMADPHNGATSQSDPNWLPANMSEYENLTMDNDNGGVHINSGIINKATYLIGTAIGKDKLEKIYYRLLDKKYLTKQAQFIDLRLAAIKSASELYGANSQEVTQVKNAFSAVGINGSSGSEPNPDLPSVNGKEWLSLVNYPIDNSDNSLYLVNPAKLTEIEHLTSTQIFTGSGKVITTPDNGAYILFIDDKNNIKIISSNGTNEQAITTDGLWNSIAISPNGQYLAATSILQTPDIYIIDIDNGTYKDIELYVPNTGSEQTTEQPDYADALDWNINNDYLIYDALNTRYDKDGNKVQYWEMNILGVSAEKIFRIIPPQDQEVNIGNPSFCQNSEYFCCFDYYDPVNGNGVFTYNLFTGEMGVIANWNTGQANFGYPVFSSKDDNLVFQAYDLQNFVFAIYKAPLDNTKLKQASTPQNIMNSAVYPYWFTVGSRPADVIDEVNKLNISIYPNPVNDICNITINEPDLKLYSADIINIRGKTVAKLGNNLSQDGITQIQWKGEDLSGKQAPAGVYYLRLTYSNESGGMLTGAYMITVAR